MSGWNITVPNTQYVGPSPQIIKDNPDSLYRDPIGSLTAQESEHFNAFITELQAHKTVAVDTETTGLCVWKDRPLYASFAWGNRRATIHASLLPWLRPVFADNSKNWIMANAKYDTHILSNVSVYNPAADVHPYGKLVDTCVAHSLLYEDMPHGLKYMCQHLGGWSWGDFQDQFGKITAAQSPTQLIRKAEIENFSLLVEYAGNDAWGTLLVFNRLKEQLERAGTHSLFRTKPPYIETLWDLFWKVEVPYTRCLWKMERHGIRVNRDVLEKARPEAEQYIQKLQHQINKLAGRVLNPRSTPQLQKWLIEERKLPPLRKTKGGKTGKRAPSTDSGFLQHYADAGDEACALVLEHREYTKLLGTYINGLHSLLDPNDRIHSRFNQDVARTGRLSCVREDTPLRTARGVKPIKNVVVGDLVWTHRGRWRRVLKTFTKGPGDMYTVQFSNGQELVCTPAHELLLASGAWKTLHEIRVQKTSNAPYPELASVHAGTPVGIQKISYCGNFEVYDLTVEEDHSYLACGVFSHNSADPNLQNIPKPDNDHWNLRGAFIAKPGHKILCFDYKQLEMRLLAAASLEQGMLDLIHAGKDIHIGNAELVFGLPYEDIVAAKACAPDQLTAYYKECLAARDAVKTIGFGIIYGMGIQKLATILGISPEDAEKKIQQFLRRYDAVEAFTKEAVEETRATGYAFTVLGRRRNIPQIASNRRKERSQGERLATNTPIQGSAADVVKMAQINYEACGYERETGCSIVLQVHDELVFECPEEHVDYMMQEIPELMRHPFYEDLAVMLDVDGGVGDSWGEAK